MIFCLLGEGDASTLRFMKRKVKYPSKRERMYPRPKKSKYKEQYGVIVICKSERDQGSVFRAAKRQFPGREIKVVVT